MSTSIKFAVNKIKHDNYNASTTPATKTLPAGTVQQASSSILIHNMDTTNNVLVSFDAGSNWKTVLPLSALNFDVCGLPNYEVKSSAGTPAVECLYGLES